MTKGQLKELFVNISTFEVVRWSTDDGSYEYTDYQEYQFEDEARAAMKRLKANDPDGDYILRVTMQDGMERLLP